MRYSLLVEHRNYRHVLPAIAVFTLVLVGVSWLFLGTFSFLQALPMFLAGGYLGKYITEYRLKPSLTED